MTPAVISVPPCSRPSRTSLRWRGIRAIPDRRCGRRRGLHAGRGERMSRGRAKDGSNVKLQERFGVDTNRAIKGPFDMLVRRTWYHAAQLGSKDWKLSFEWLPMTYGATVGTMSRATRNKRKARRPNREPTSAYRLEGDLVSWGEPPLADNDVDAPTDRNAGSS